MDHLCFLCLSCFASVHCCLVVTCWERADPLAPLGDVNCIFVTFPCGILGQVWYLIVSFPDLCHLSYFVSTCQASSYALLINFLPKLLYPLYISNHLGCAHATL